MEFRKKESTWIMAPTMKPKVRHPWRWEIPRPGATPMQPKKRSSVVPNASAPAMQPTWLSEKGPNIESGASRKEDLTSEKSQEKHRESK